MPRFDDTVQQLIDTGVLTEAQAAELRDSSPLKAERDAAKAEADANAARARQLEEKVAADVFAKLGIPGAPNAYNLAGVDMTNEDAVAAWARDQKLIAPAGPTPEEIEAHQRMSGTTASGQQPPPPPAAADRMVTLRRKVETAGRNELYPGSALYNETLDAIREAGLEFGNVERTGNFERIPEWGATK